MVVEIISIKIAEMGKKRIVTGCVSRLIY